MTTLYTRLAYALALLCAGLAIGWTINGWRLQSQLERAKTALSQQVALVAQAREQQARQAAQQLEAANTAAQQAIAHAQQRTQTALAQNAKLQQEINHATSATRPGLSAAAGKLLSSLPAFAGPALGLRLPAPAASAAGAAAAAATAAGRSAPGATSERALAGWVAQTAAQYEQCRAQIDGLRAWAQSLPQTDLLSDSSPRK